MRFLANAIIIGTVFAASTAALAQQQTATAGATPAQNPFDLSAAQQALGDKIPTVPGIAQLEKDAQSLLAAGDCKAAVDVLDRYAKEANALSNMIARGPEGVLNRQ